MKRKLFLPLILVLCIAVFAKAETTDRFNVNLYTGDEDTTEVFNIADEMPEIEGGLQEVYKHIEYPRQARRAKIEGRVFIKFIVDENGKVQDPVVLKDIGSGCGEAAIAGIKKVTFTPGKNAGKPVKVYYTLPITFKLQ